MTFVRLTDGVFRTGTDPLPYFVKEVKDQGQYVAPIPVELAWQ